MERTANHWLSFTLPLQRLFVRIGVLPFLLVIALIVFTALSDRFLTGENLITVARQTTYLAIVAMGQMLALLTGGFDLSVGKIVAITSVITALTMAPLKAAHPDAMALTLTLGILAGVGAGTVVGVVNGLGIAVLRRAVHDDARNRGDQFRHRPDADKRGAGLRHSRRVRRRLQFRPDTR